MENAEHVKLQRGFKLNDIVTEYRLLDVELTWAEMVEACQTEFGDEWGLATICSEEDMALFKSVDLPIPNGSTRKRAFIGYRRYEDDATKDPKR